MNNQDFVDSAVLVEAAGVSNPKTLSRWANLNLIPPPVRGKRAFGVGSMGKWPKWVADRCTRIRQLRSQGKTLQQIADHLGSDWELEEARYRLKQPTVKKDEPKLERFTKSTVARGRSAALQNLRDTVWRRTSVEFAEARRKRGDWTELIGMELIETAIELMRDGIRPLLVLDEFGLSLTADFAISTCLHDRGHVSESIIIVPIADDLLDWLILSESIAPDQWIAPVSEVEVSSKKTSRRQLIVGKDWTFDVGKRI